MEKLVTKWESTEPNPDEKMLRKEWQDEVDSLNRSVELQTEAVRSDNSKLSMLLESANIKKDVIQKQLQQDKKASDEAYKAALKKIAKPTIDIEALHKQELAVVKATAENMKSSGNPFWQGYVWDASYAGAWWEYNGEREEIPSVSFNVGSNRIDPRAQAYGEGWYDADHSRIHAYLAFRITPPSFGHLHLVIRPWLHGFYSLYSNDTWYKSESATADLDTWVDLHQNFWRARHYNDRFRLSGQELHPERSGRIDSQVTESYRIEVGERDPITIRVGVRMYCRGKANGGRARLDFSSGGANYVYVPYVYWYLHQ